MDKKKLVYWLNILGLVLSVVSVFMLFLPSMQVTISETGKEVGLYNGFQTMFGYVEKTYGGVDKTVLGFSAMNFISGMLILLGVIVMFTNVFMPSLGGNKGKLIRSIVAIALLIVGGILAMFSVAFVVTVGDKWIILTKTLREGPILQGVIAILAGASVVMGMLLERNKAE